ncbi:Uncharacterised protein [Chlamydia trachomatis]|nr:Uncharacterised protein [Chlamydia trachomatis]
MAAAGNGQDDHLKFAALRLMDGHGIGQGNPVPFVSGVENLISVEVDGDFVLLGVGVFGGKEVGDITQITIKNIAFSVIDQMDDPVALTESLVIVLEFKGVFHQGIKQGLRHEIELVNPCGSTVHGC